MTIKVSLLYSPKEGACIDVSFEIPKGTTVGKALEIAQFYKNYPKAEGLPVGIFSNLVTLDKILNEGDRIEIYRPLFQDPKAARRLRAKK